MQVIPALDLRAGRVVRLVQGDFERETRFGGDPLERGRQSAAAGARRLHVVDLDAAAGRGSNREVVAGLVRGAGLEVQVAGGVRTEADVDAWLDAGAAGVVMGTTAAREPQTLRACAERHPGRVLAALDLSGGRPAVAGWLAAERRPFESLLEEWESAPLAGVILTCVDRDGTLAGPDLDMLIRVLSATSHPLTYSGGIAGLDDLGRVARAGAAAVILGRSLLEGRFTLEEAIAACASVP